MLPVEIRDIADLKPSDHNPRQHTARSQGAIVASLENVGPWRSIAIDENDQVIAGNGVVDGCGEMGIERVMIIEPPANTLVAVKRTGLSEAQKAKYEVADNFIPTLSEWDAMQLSHNADDFKFDLVAPGLFTEKELADLADQLLGDAAKADQGGPEMDKELQVVVACNDYEQQQELVARLEGEGFKCKAKRRKPRSA